MQKIAQALKFFMVSAAVVAAVPLFAFAQTPQPAPPVKPHKVRVPAREAPRPFPVAGIGVDSEKSMIVDPKVNVSLPCVSEGNVKINGWSRSEVRVFVKDGSKVGLKIRQKNRQTGDPNWVEIIGLPQDRLRPRGSSECLWGEIELDVPSGAAVTLKGRETTTTIDSIRKVSIETGGGDISVRNISDGVYAKTYEGGVTVENSNGPMVLDSSGGNVVAYEVGPSEIGDTFKAKTSSGMISLQNLEHRQIEVNSISGSVLFNGTFSSGGLYNFITQNGSITLALAKDASCMIRASYGYGEIRSELSLKNAIYGKGAATKSLTATLGGGDGTLKLTTTSGLIHLKNQ